MKRIFAILLILVLLLSACGTTSVNQGEAVTLTFIYCDQNIQVELKSEEAQKVIDILDGNSYDPVFAGTPSCGFDENISLKVGGQVFAIACDTCNYVQAVDGARYFSISQTDMEYIHALFAQYGGYFPCV